NPYRDHAGERDPKYSPKPTQDERAEDVRLGLADTDMTEQMIAAVNAIKTLGPRPKQVFRWGGDFRTLKDTMHFEIAVPPAEIEKGIDWSTVAGGSASDDAAVPELSIQASSESSSIAATVAGAKG